jgi:phosphatidylglycerophosphatase A
LASAFGLGYLPKAPGTYGTLGAIPLWYAMAGLPGWAFALVTVAAIGVATAIAELAERVYGGHDTQKIVIDEVVGLLATVVGVPFRWPEVLAAFVLFRLLDMWKPQPIRWIDDHVQGGFGVVFDDVAAGVVGCLVLHTARVLLGGWW